jgi:hypothetical protein
MLHSRLDEDREIRKEEGKTMIAGLKNAMQWYFDFYMC